MTIFSTLFELFYTFFKIGLFTIGGGYAMIPMIKAEMLQKGWIGVQELIDFIAVAESTPGPFAINIATFVGTEVGGNFAFHFGILGAFVATLGVVLPSFFIILFIAKYFHAFKDNRYVKAILVGLRPTVIGLIAAAALTIALSVVVPNFSIASMDFSLFNWRALIIVALAFAFQTWKKKLHPIYMIAGSAVLGIVLFGLL